MLLTAVGGAALALVAGAGPRAAATLAAIGLLFALFLLASSAARCPACGARLREKSRPGPEGETGPATVEAPASCPRCRERFE